MFLYGNELNFDSICEPSSAEVKFIITEEDYLEFANFQKQNANYIVKIGEMDFDFGKEVLDSSTRHGYYILKYDGDVRIS